MEQDNKPTPKEDLAGEYADLVETPLFSRFKEWWRAKKVSLDLFGVEKVLGVDNRQYKAAVKQYTNLQEEIELQYKEVVKNPDVTPEEIETAKAEREAQILDAKKDFVYHMPEDYRTWFKKRKVFNSWRHAPEAWGFEESRYWGSRSGLTVREKQILIGGLVIGSVVIGFIVYRIATYTPPVQAVVRELKVEKDSTMNNVDSLMRVKEQQRQQRTITERNNIIINEINSGVYTTQSWNPQDEIRLIMSLYYQYTLYQTIAPADITNEGLKSASGLIYQNNPDVFTKFDAAGLPTVWKSPKKIKLNWDEIRTGVERDKKVRAIRRK